MKTLPRFDETEISVEDGVITIKQVQSYNTRSIQIPVALWGTFVDAVSEEVYPYPEAAPYPDTVQP